MDYKCPKCGCTDVGQYKHPRSDIWCRECGYIYLKESNGIAPVKPLDPSTESGYIPPLPTMNPQLLDKETFIQQYVLLNRHQYFSVREVVTAAVQALEQIKLLCKESECQD